MIFFAQISARKRQTSISVHDVWEPLKQVLWASRDVIISSQICGSNVQRFFTLGDGCWLPKYCFQKGKLNISTLAILISPRESPQIAKKGPFSTVNTIERPLLRTLLRALVQNPFLERYVAIRPLRLHPIEDMLLCCWSPLPNISTLAILISPRESPQIGKNGVPKMNFPELPGPRVSVEILHKP